MQKALVPIELKRKKKKRKGEKKEARFNNNSIRLLEKWLTHSAVIRHTLKSVTMEMYKFTFCFVFDFSLWNVICKFANNNEQETINHLVAGECKQIEEKAQTLVESKSQISDLHWSNWIAFLFGFFLLSLFLYAFSCSMQWSHVKHLIVLCDCTLVLHVCQKAINSTSITA